MNILFVGKISSGKSTILTKIHTNIISTDKIVEDIYKENNKNKQEIKQNIISGVHTLYYYEQIWKDSIIQKIKEKISENVTIVNIVEISYCSYLKEIIPLFDAIFEVENHSKYIEYNKMNKDLLEKIVYHQNKNYFTSKDFIKVNEFNFIDNVVNVVLQENTSIDIITIKQKYDEYGRYYHTYNHLENIFSQITFSIDNILAVCFHDIVYNPKENNNEEKSIEYMNTVINYKNKKVEELIMSTKDLQSTTEIGIIDREILFSTNTKELISWENKIFKEYSCYPVEQYKVERIKFIEKYVHSSKHAKELISYIQNKDYKIGFYAGSFNPFTIGHFDILQQAEKIFDKVIIGIGKNHTKQEIQTTSLSTKITNTHEISYYDGYLIDAIIEKYSLIRGIRNSKDLEEEKALKNHIEDFSKINIVYFICKKEHEYISSSYVRQLTKEMSNKYLI